MRLLLEVYDGLFYDTIGLMLVIGVKSNTSLINCGLTISHNKLGQLTKRGYFKDTRYFRKYSFLNELDRKMHYHYFL